jgi:hypothetical protein
VHVLVMYGCKIIHKLVTSGICICTSILGYFMMDEMDLCYSYNLKANLQFEIHCFHLPA